MVKKENIKTFVQKTLGCSCPEEVFAHIDCRSNIQLNNILLRNKISIGNKLLIFVVEVHNDESFEDTLKSLVYAGRKERDSVRFNRFRLVLAAENPGVFKQRVCDIFDSLEKDDRVHLHVLHKDEIKKLRAEC
jgi:hypothetical protein